MVTLDGPAVHGGTGVDPFHNYSRTRQRRTKAKQGSEQVRLGANIHYCDIMQFRFSITETWGSTVSTLRINMSLSRWEVQRFQCVPEKWWWKQILARTWWKDISTPSSLTELLFRSPDSSSFAKASLRRQKATQRSHQYDRPPAPVPSCSQGWRSPAHREDSKILRLHWKPHTNL